MASKPLFRPRKYTWIIPLIVLFSGVLKFYNVAFPLTDISTWYVLVGLAVVMFVIGIIQHKKYNELNT